MRAPISSLYRLMWVQAGWTYERMGGIGIAFAAAPLLAAAVVPEKLAEARARSAEFFNSHPWLAGMAVGASARAERDGVAPEQVRRLRAALGGPLGALGDRVIWAGLVPILSAVAVIGGGLWGWWMPIVAVALAAVLRWEVTRWSLKRGLEYGMRVATVLKDCTLSRVSAPAGLVAAGVIGLAATFVARGSLARIAPGLQGRYVMLLAAFALIIVLRAGARLPAYRLALIGGSLVLLLFQAVAP